ncbi:uncharacterized protein ACO6RY_13025 [Pungitius sinensis]
MVSVLDMLRSMAVRKRHLQDIDSIQVTLKLQVALQGGLGLVVVVQPPMSLSHRQQSIRDRLPSGHRRVAIFTRSLPRWPHGTATPPSSNGHKSPRGPGHPSILPSNKSYCPKWPIGTAILQGRT